MEAKSREEEDIGVQKITLEIPKDKYKFVQEKGWKHKEVYLLGLKAKEEHPQLLGRIQSLEKYKESAYNRIAGLWKDVQNQDTRIRLLEKRMAEIEALLPPRAKAKIKTAVIDVE